MLPLLRELNDLKRLYSHRLGADSFATRVFRHAAAEVQAGSPLNPLEWTAALVAATRLGAISPLVLEDAGLDTPSTIQIFVDSIEAHDGLSGQLKDDLSAACASFINKFGGVAPSESQAPAGWIDNLSAAPRAGATCPGKPRIALEPAEFHSDHSVMVAAYGCLLADCFGSDRESAWLIGLCHHFHNAELPDAGFTGEVLLGSHLKTIVENFRELVSAQLDASHRSKIDGLFREIEGDTTPLAQTFHAADTIDRVLQMEHFERSAQFQVRQALDDLNLVHESPVQTFQHGLLDSLGLLSPSHQRS